MTRLGQTFGRQGIARGAVFARHVAIVAAVLALASPLFEGRASGAACTNPGLNGYLALTNPVNAYYPCTSSVSAGATSIPIGARDGRATGYTLSPGQLIIVMQMQDASISDSNSTSYGGSSNGSGYTSLNSAGLYEYATVSDTYAGGGVSPVTITAGLQNNYHCSAATGTQGQSTFQVIVTPQLSSGIITTATTLAPPYWNGATGGVLAVDVAGAFNWNGGTVNVTGMGFRGGGGLYLKGVSAAGTFANTDYVTISTSGDNGAGFPHVVPGGPYYGANGVKGEGIAGTPGYVYVPSTQGEAQNTTGSELATSAEGYPGGCMARGAPGNAGGGGTDGDPAAIYAGGNDWNSGGGGGGGYAQGGQGGIGWDGANDVCPTTSTWSDSGGMGGIGISMGIPLLVMGGGGGAGSSNNGSGIVPNNVGASGAPGGGIFILRAGTLSGTGTINANGAAGFIDTAECNDAGGGGGGGGAVMIFASGGGGSIGTLTINANGGQGGSNTGNSPGENVTGTCPAQSGGVPHGPGGGGGGGFIAITSATGVTLNYAGGLTGTTATSSCTDSSYGSSSSPGGFNIDSYTAAQIPGSSPSPLCYPSLTVTKTTGQSNTVAGGQTNYTITVSNAAGYGDAETVLVTDTLPGLPNATGIFQWASTTSITLNGGATNTGTVVPAANSNTPQWGNFTIPGGGSVIISFVVNVPTVTTLTTVVGSPYANPASITYADPTRGSGGQQLCTPGGTYAGGGTVPGSNFAAGAPVTVYAPATIAKSFNPTTINPGGTSTLTITVQNPNTATAITGASFTDTFPAAMFSPGGNIAMAGAGCTGWTTASSGYTSLAIPANATAFTLGTGSIAATDTCTFTLTVKADTCPQAANTIVPGAFTANLNIINTSSSTSPGTLWFYPTIVKSWGTNPVATGTSSLLTIAITNPNYQTISVIKFTDTFPANLQANGGLVEPAAGACSAFAGTLSSNPTNPGVYTNTAGTITAGGTCNVVFDAQSGTALSYSNQILSVTATTNGSNTLGAASNIAVLDVGTTIGIQKAFAPSTIASGATGAAASTITFTLSNSTNTANTHGTFTDTLTNMYASGAQTLGGTCTWGGATPTLTNNQTGLITFSNINIPRNATCTITLLVSSTSAGTNTNSTSGVTTTQNTIGLGSNIANLIVVGAPTLTTAYNPTTIQSGATSTYTYTITNNGTNTVALTGGTITDTLPANVKIATTGAPGGTCVGVALDSVTAGATTVSLANITVPVGSSCTVTVPVTSTTVGTYTDTSAGFTSTTPSPAVSGVTSSNTLTVVGTPTIAKSWSPTSIGQGASSTLTLTLLNNASNAIALTGAAFSDVLNVNLAVAGVGSVTAGGTCTGASGNSFTAGSYGTTLSFSGITIPTGGTGCTVTIPITGTNSGTYSNTVSGVTTTQTPSASGTSTASLTIFTSPTASVAFNPLSILTTGSSASAYSTFTITLTNPNASQALTSTAFTDSLPAGTAIATAVTGAPWTGFAGGTCTGVGTNALTTGQTSLSFSGITIPAASSCTITFPVSASAVSPSAGYANTTSTITTAYTTTAAPPSAYLYAFSYVTIAKAFSPTTIAANGTSTITFTLTNPNNLLVDNVVFTDTFPAGMTTSPASGNQTYGGTCTASPNATANGAGSVGLGGITIPANSSCTITALITETTIGSYTNTTTGVTSAQTGVTAGPTASAVLLVGAKATITKAFSVSPLDAYSTTNITFTVANSNAGSSLTNCNFTDNLAAVNLYVEAIPMTFSCAGTTNAPTLTVGATALNLTIPTVPASSSCTITVPVTSASGGTDNNTTSGVTCTNFTAGAVSNTATVVFNKLPMTFVKTASPANPAPGTNVTYTLTYTNPNATMADQAIVISDVITPSMHVNYVSSACGANPLNITLCTPSAPACSGVNINNCTITWTMTGTLAAGKSGSVTLVVQVQ